MRKPKKKRVNPFKVPTTHYTSFRERLTSLLEEDGSYAAKYLLAEFESKLLDPNYSDPPAVRRQRAIDKWLATEERNSETNIRLMFSEDNDVLHDGEQTVTFGDIVHYARELILATIGASPDYDALRGSFSGGASTSTKRGPLAIARKYLAGCDSTEAAYAVFSVLNFDSVCWNPLPNWVKGNVLFTVPKSTSIDRVACKEPDLNMYVQKAVGNFFRRSLRKKGINLNKQEINQDLAYLGSLTGELATVDLSSASDTVSLQVVQTLLPFEWYSLLLDLRSAYTLIDGTWHENMMFSSMGNAFTFELESLIFWALTRSTMRAISVHGRVSVYGDDIICPSRGVMVLRDVFSHFGFSLNLEKSHWEGTFRESCGKHYNSGEDVSPFYIRKVPTDASDWIHILNHLRKWISSNSGDYLDAKYFQLWSDFSKLVPPSVMGGWDYERRDILVSPGRRPIARLAPKQRRLSKMEDTFNMGAYLHWLNAAESRTLTPISTCLPTLPIWEALVTSEVISDGDLRIVRVKTPVWSGPIKVFDDEIIKA